MQKRGQETGTNWLVNVAIAVGVLVIVALIYILYIAPKLNVNGLFG
jgi:hypothetical protein